MNTPKTTGLTSDEASALILSEGKTSDPEQVADLHSYEYISLDALEAAELRDMMGFDFKVRQSGNKFLVSAKDGSRLRTSAKLEPGDMDEYGNITSEAVVDRLVDACLRLKLKWEKANANH